MSRTIIAVDFDGTIVAHKFPKIGKPAPGAFEWMRKWQDTGALLILYTMRSDGRKDGSRPLTEASVFCASHGVYFWWLNHNLEQHTWTESPKVYAHLYVDDMAIGCPMIANEDGDMVADWSIIGPLVMERIESRKKAFEG